MMVGSGIRKNPTPGSLIPDPGLIKAPDPRSGSATLLAIGFCIRIRLEPESNWILFNERAAPDVDPVLKLPGTDIL